MVEILAFVKLEFCPTHFTITFAGQTNVDHRYTEDR